MTKPSQASLGKKGNQKFSLKEKKNLKLDTFESSLVQLKYS